MHAGLVFRILISIPIVLCTILVMAGVLKARLWTAQQTSFVLLLFTYGLAAGLQTIAGTAVVNDPGFNTSGTDPDTLSMQPCRTPGFFHIWISVGCLSALCTVLYDRLAYISAPVTYADRLSWRVRAVLISVAVAHSLGLALLPILGWGSYRYSSSLGCCEVAWGNSHGYGIFLMLLGYILPLILIVAAYIRLVVLVHRRIQIVKIYSIQNVTSTWWPLNMRQNIDEGSFTETDVAFLQTWKTLTVIVTFAVLAGISTTANILCLITWGQEVMNPTTYHALSCVALFTHIANPIAYGVYNSRYRRAVVSIVTLGRLEETEVQHIFHSGTHEHSPDGAVEPHHRPLGERLAEPVAAGEIQHTTEPVEGLFPKTVWN